MALELDRAAVRIGGRTIWSELSMRMGRGEFMALLGANGSGKSTLLKVVLGALPPITGEVTVLGRPPGGANRSIGYLPPSAMRWVRRSAGPPGRRRTDSWSALVH